MNLIICTQSFDFVGGEQSYLSSLIQTIRKNGNHDIALITSQSIRPTSSFNHGFDSLDFKEIETYSIDHLGLQAILDRVKNRFHYCYLHSFATRNDEIMISKFVPTLRFLHNLAGTCISGHKKVSFPSSHPCQRIFGPRCLGLYLPKRCGGLNPLTMIKGYSFNKEYLRSLHFFPAIAFASNYMRNEYIRHGLSPDKCHLLPLPIPGQETDLHPPDRRSSFTNRLLFTGRLTNLKGVHYLVKALPELIKILGRKMELIIAGDGPELSKLQEYAKSRKLPVEFTGWINRQRREELMRSVDLLVVPSLWPEPFGLVGIEAGCVGLPAVAFEVGGIPDWLIPGETGELASGNPPRISGLTQAIVRALSDLDYHHQLRMGAWKKSKEFSTKLHIERLMNILQTLHKDR